MAYFVEVNSNDIIDWNLYEVQYGANIPRKMSDMTESSFAVPAILSNYITPDQ